MGQQRSSDQGVRFPLSGGNRSSQATGREVFAAAAAAVDPDLADRISSATNWRKSYIDCVRDVVAAGVPSSDAAVGIARAGLRAASEQMRFVRDGHESSLSEAFETRRESVFETATIAGRGSASRPRLRIAYRGVHLEGDALSAQLDRWEQDGVIEPSCRQAIGDLVAHADWLDLSDLTVVLLGAASEMGPLSSLMHWGANVIAVDLPRPRLWEHIVRVAREGRGRLHAPVRTPVTEPDAIAASAGADLVIDGPEVRTWLGGFDGPFTIGNYVYADGARFALLESAVDQVTGDLFSQKSNVSLAYLATPTDVYAVTPEIVKAARRGRGGRRAQVARLTSAGRLCVENYGEPVMDGDGQAWGISDCLIAQQGPNYALAKSLQRWRAVAARSDGRVVSANLAPATNTRSVMKNKVLSAAYAGAHRFGVEIFEPETSATLMAALLVHDLRNPKAPARPETHLRHSYELWLQGAAHGGILRLPYEPRTLLPLAALIGLPRALRS